MKLTVVRKSPKLMQAVENKAVRGVKKVVYTATQYVASEAKQSILQNPRAGREVVRYNPKRTVRTSAEGDPPASDTGNLATLISTEVRADGMSGKCISKASYSKALEYGTSKMAARPFLQPAAEKTRPLIKAQLKGIL